MKKPIFFICFFIFLCILPTGSFAMGADGSGNGDSSGSGDSEPLALVHSTVADGEVGVETNRRLQLVFNSNISNITVKENNAGCFAVTDDKGVNVPTSVIIFDDQLEREMRRDIHLDINDGLKAGKTYAIKISKNLTAKNGKTLGREIKITFTTAATLEPIVSGQSSNHYEEINKSKNALNSASEGLDIDAMNTTAISNYDDETSSPNDLMKGKENSLSSKIIDAFGSTTLDTYSNQFGADLIKDENVFENKPTSKVNSSFIWLVGALLAAAGAIIVYHFPEKKHKKRAQNKGA